MPHDLFDDAVLPTSARTRRRRDLTIFSVAFHAMVVTTIVVVQVFAVGPLPLPRRPMLFEEIRLVHLADIHVPSPRRVAAGRAAGSGSSTPAPTAEPTAIRRETVLEPLVPGPGSGDGVVGMVNEIDSIESIGRPEPVRPPAWTPPAPVHLHRGIEPPKKIEDVPPVYPAMARVARVEGIVILEAVIDAHGNVTSVAVRRSNAMLDQPAIDAVRQWRYTPALLNGQPVPVIVTITVRFQLK